jgi:hypothetical protein
MAEIKKKKPPPMTWRDAEGHVHLSAETEERARDAEHEDLPPAPIAPILRKPPD